MPTFFMSRFTDATLVLLRIVAGLLFMQHGAQKLFGLLDGRQIDTLFSLMGLAGVLEFFGGMLIVLGLFTRPVAFVLCGEMAFAYFMAHFPRSPFPILNRGEHVVLFCFIFLMLSAHGPGSFSLDRLIRGRREKERDAADRPVGAEVG